MASAAALAYYRQVLNVRADADASTLKNAYREASRVHHPDHPGGSEEAFQLVGEAYNTLTQHAHRRRADHVPPRWQVARRLRSGRPRRGFIEVDLGR